MLWSEVAGDTGPSQLQPYFGVARVPLLGTRGHCRKTPLNRGFCAESADGKIEAEEDQKTRLRQYSQRGESRLVLGSLGTLPGHSGPQAHCVR